MLTSEQQKAATAAAAAALVSGQNCDRDVMYACIPVKKSSSAIMLAVTG